jgi:hypothetical protein
VFIYVCCTVSLLLDRTHIALALDGVEIISNSSGSHHQLRKSNKRINIIRNATAKVSESASCLAVNRNRLSFPLVRRDLFVL